MSLRNWARSFFSPPTTVKTRDKRHSRVGSTATTFRPRAESLEARLNMAGNVLVSAIGANLYITGDNLANEIRIEPNVAGVDVQGINNTAINGLLNGETNGFNVQNIFIDMANGDDKAEFVQTNLSGLLRFNGGNGKDSLLFGDGNNGQNSFGSLQAILGDGDDKIDVHDTETSFRVTGAVTVMGGEGENAINFDPAGPLVLGSVSYTGGNGKDKLLIGADGFAINTGFLSINGGNGDNTYSLAQGVVNGGISLFGGKDDDTFTSGSSDTLRVNGSVTAALGDGMNFVSFIHQEDTVVSGLVSITGGAHRDFVILSSFDTLALSLSLGAGANSADVSFGVIRSSFTYTTLGGTNTVGSTDLDVYGSTLISTGDGADVVDIANSRFRSVVTVMTAGGADRVFLENDMIGRLGERITQFDSTVTIDLGAGDDLLEIGISDILDEGDFDEDMYATFAYLFANGGLGNDTLNITPHNVHSLPPTFISFP